MSNVFDWKIITFEATLALLAASLVFQKGIGSCLCNQCMGNASDSSASPKNYIIGRRLCTSCCSKFLSVCVQPWTFVSEANLTSVCKSERKRVDLTVRSEVGSILDWLPANQKANINKQPFMFTIAPMGNLVFFFQWNYFVSTHSWNVERRPNKQRGRTCNLLTGRSDPRFKLWTSKLWGRCAFIW